jgi:nitrous oxide reductase accessory protein NosL
VDAQSTVPEPEHCAAIDLAINIDKTPKTIWVGNCSIKQLIEAEKALWVIDRKKVGVMTQRAKWAFEKKEDEDKARQNKPDELCS